MGGASTAASEEIYDGKVVHLFVDDVVLPNGHATRLEVVRHPGAACVLPIDVEGRALLVRQWRHATGGWLLEAPAGKLEPGEPPEVCARREMEEEAGVTAGRLVPLGAIWTTPGFSDERIWLYAAFDLTITKQATTPDEVLTLERLALGEALRLADEGEISDAKTVCALLRARRFATARTGAL